jgi:hypothetical protein
MKDNLIRTSNKISAARPGSAEPGSHQVEG